MPNCLTCGAELTERPGAKSKRAGQTLFICPAGHKNQGRFDGQYWHIYQSNAWKNRQSERRKQVAVTASESDRALMKQKGFMPQNVWQLGIDFLDGM